MDTNVESKHTFLDTVILLFAVAVLVGSIVGYYYFVDESLLLRSVGVLVAIALAIWIAFQSARGRALWAFIQSSRVELRKVVWPTREETIQTTLVVIVFAMVMAMFFWLLDLFLYWFTTFFTGQGS